MRATRRPTSRYRIYPSFPRFWNVLSHDNWCRTSTPTDFYQRLNPVSSEDIPQRPTATIHVLSDLLDSVDRGDTAVLVLLDLTAAFDTVDHEILLKCLRATFGMDSIALASFSSYLAGCKQQVRCGGKTSAIMDVICGVPQGSVLGPILFIIYTVDLASIVADRGLSLHQYADDSQIYGSCLPAAISSL